MTDKLDGATLASMRLLPVSMVLIGWCLGLGAGLWIADDRGWIRMAVERVHSSTEESPGGSSPSMPAEDVLDSPFERTKATMQALIGVAALTGLVGGIVGVVAFVRMRGRRYSLPVAWAGAFCSLFIAFAVLVITVGFGIAAFNVGGTAPPNATLWTVRLGKCALFITVFLYLARRNVMALRTGGASEEVVHFPKAWRWWTLGWIVLPLVVGIGGGWFLEARTASLRAAAELSKVSR